MKRGSQLKKETEQVREAFQVADTEHTCEQSGLLSHWEWHKEAVALGVRNSELKMKRKWVPENGFVCQEGLRVPPVTLNSEYWA